MTDILFLFEYPLIRQGHFFMTTVSLEEYQHTMPRFDEQLKIKGISYRHCASGFIKLEYFQ